MINIDIVAIGKEKDSWVLDSLDHFSKLLLRYAEINWVIIPNLKKKASYRPDEIKKMEAESFKKNLKDSRYIALADHGLSFDSYKLAEKIDKYLAGLNGRLTFVIGGAYGLDKNLLDQADMIWSLSPLTFSHQLVRPILLEQLYRAFSITNNTDYHK